LSNFVVLKRDLPVVSVQRSHAASAQDDGRLAVFVYVWREEHRQRLKDVPWDFDHFVKNNLQAYWHEELETEYM
jgi:hypothetical protein